MVKNTDVLQSIEGLHLYLHRLMNDGLDEEGLKKIMSASDTKLVANLVENKKEGITYQELCRATFSAKSTSSISRQKLEKNELVYRFPMGGCTPATRFYPTETAEELYPEYCRLTDDLFAKAFKDIPEEDYNVFVSVLTKAIENLDTSIVKLNKKIAKGKERS